MPISRAPITGSVPMPDGAAFTAARLIFRLSATDSEDDAAIPASEVSVALTGAAIPAGFAVWRNTEGVAATTYEVSLDAQFEVVAGVSVRRRIVLGNVQIGAAASYDIGALLRNPVPPNAGWNVNLDPAEYAALQASLAASLRLENATISVTVGGAPGPLNFATIGAAIQYLSRVVPLSDMDDVQGTILIKSGWTAQEQVLIEGLNLGWVSIRSEDATVPVLESALTANDAFEAPGVFPFLSARNGASCPRIKTKFVCTPDGLNRNTVGLLLRGATYTDNLNQDMPPWSHGLSGFWENCTVQSGSTAFLAFKDFSDARRICLRSAHQSGVSLISCRAVGAVEQAVSARNGSKINILNISHETAGAVVTTARLDPAGLVDSLNDLRVTTGGILSISTGTIGGISQAANVATAAGMILDERATVTVVPGIIAPQTYTVATVPSAAAFVGDLIYVSNGAAGLPILAFSDGTNWLRVDTRAAISV